MEKGFLEDPMTARSFFFLWSSTITIIMYYRACYMLKFQLSKILEGLEKRPMAEKERAFRGGEARRDSQAYQFQICG